ncbi:hypothetical protein JRQ81_009020 [Phrynocephalus forsythii]|uniref:RIIa domain-containing protein n=1 Tax=Phrynocephalus forsythii TaxID=171643 RepID=A0A9Q0XB92_9SAUR|nr:hypothetical protein JRQ81_009020 [Phrynocephalus forsythii]
MAASEKRRPPPAATTGREPSRPVATATGNGSPEGAAEFLLQARATDLVREALLKVLEARPEEPVDFLAGYFQQLMQHRSRRRRRRRRKKRRPPPPPQEGRPRLPGSNSTASREPSGASAWPTIPTGRPLTTTSAWPTRP